MKTTLEWKSAKITKVKSLLVMLSLWLMEKEAEEHEKEIKWLNEENVKIKLIISVIIILLL